MKTRVLKGHKKAVLDSLSETDVTDADDLATRVATAVLTAYDDKMRYVIVTDDYLAFGPYATRTSAEKVATKGLCAFRAGTKAMVLPMKPSPTVKSQQMGTTPMQRNQLTLF